MDPKQRKLVSSTHTVIDFLADLYEIPSTGSGTMHYFFCHETRALNCSSVESGSSKTLAGAKPVCAS